MRISRGWLVFGLAGTVLLASVLVWMRPARRVESGVGPSGVSGRPPESQPTLLEPAPHDAAPKSDGRETAPEADSPEEGRPRVVYESSLDYLEAYWGADWPALRAELEQRAPEQLTRYESLQLTEDLVPPPLSEVHDEAVARLLEAFDSDGERNSIAYRVRAEPWPDSLTSEFLVQRVAGTFMGYAPEQVARAQAALESVRESLRRSREDYFSAARGEFERAARAGEYVAWPLIYVGPGTSPSTGGAPLPGTQRNEGQTPGFTVTVSMNGIWIISLGLSLGEYPHLLMLWRELERKGMERTKMVEEALSE